VHHGGVVVERVIVVVPLKASVVLDVLRVILEVKEMLVELELCVTDTLVEVLEGKIPVEVIVIVLLDVYVADVVLVELVVLTDDFVELVLVDMVRVELLIVAVVEVGTTDGSAKTSSAASRRRFAKVCQDCAELCFARARVKTVRHQASA